MHTKDPISLADAGKYNPVHLQVKTPESNISLALSAGFSWERSLADKNHLLGGTEEQVEKRGGSASTETTKPQS